jgi:hypothetical protein
VPADHAAGGLTPLERPEDLQSLLRELEDETEQEQQVGFSEKTQPPPPCPMWSMNQTPDLDLDSREPVPCPPQSPRSLASSELDGEDSPRAGHGTSNMLIDLKELARLAGC